MSQEQGFQFQKLPRELGAHVLRFLANKDQPNRPMAAVARDFSNVFRPRHLLLPSESASAIQRYEVFDFTALESGHEHRAAWLKAIQQEAHVGELRVLRLDDVALEEKEIMEALGGVTQLRELCLFDSPGVDNVTLRSLFLSNRLLRRVVLRHCESVGLRAFTEGEFSTLPIHEFVFQDHSRVGNNLMKGLPASVQRLDISRCSNLNDDALTLISQHITQRCMPLRELVITDGNVSPGALQRFKTQHANVRVRCVMQASAPAESRLDMGGRRH